MKISAIRGNKPCRKLELPSTLKRKAIGKIRYDWKQTYLLEYTFVLIGFRIIFTRLINIIWIATTIHVVCAKRPFSVEITTFFDKIERNIFRQSIARVIFPLLPKRILSSFLSKMFIFTENQLCSYFRNREYSPKKLNHLNFNVQKLHSYTSVFINPG